MQKTGSVRRGIVASDLVEERAKIAYDKHELRLLLSGGEEKLKKWKEVVDVFGNDPDIRNFIEFNELTPHEMQQNLWKRINVLYERYNERFFIQSAFDGFCDWPAILQGHIPLGLHVSMFRLSVENLASEEQRAKWLPMV